MDSILPLNTAGVLTWGAVTITTAAFSHYFNRKKHLETSQARDKFLFDEAFIIVKKFFVKASYHTVEETQAFGNNFVPAPYWVRVVRCVVPASSLAAAAEVINETLPEDELVNVIGGRQWWQRTAHKSGGVDGEWIAMKRDWQGLNDDAQGNEDLKRRNDEKIKKMKENAKFGSNWNREGRTESQGDDNLAHEIEEDATYSEDLDEMRCVLFIHGGAYFFGSINTHRHALIRISRKIGGRVFAVNYRLAPQYPFPCALQDALASYLYLIRPPPGAKHKAVDPAKLTVAGDSAGGGLSLALMCLIRDSGLPPPAGCLLISPWCDLSHSFPSILQNTKSDVIPPYGFLFKPSTLWPPPPDDFRERAEQSTSLSGLKKASTEFHDKAAKHKKSFFSITTANKKGRQLAEEVGKIPDDPQRAEGDLKHTGQRQTKGEVGKRIKLKIDGEEVELVDQIQLYATNEQLVYPYVSPVWQPSLGGLPPLYIMCGDKEVLRDEIIYLAHRAAHPDKFPLRKALIEANPERAEKHKQYPPTQVHLQIYDGICHDLPLFSFTVPARYCYRAMASFIKFVTPTTKERNEHGDIIPPSPVSRTDMELPVEQDPTHPDAAQHDAHHLQDTMADAITDTSGSTTPAHPRSELGGAQTKSPPRHKREPRSGLEKTIYSSTQPFNRPPYVDNMIRERISLTGVVRPLEPMSEVDILHIDPEDLGLIKEGPVRRYLAGKAIWDKKFKKTYERVQKQREKNLRKSMREEATRITNRMRDAKHKHEQPSAVDKLKNSENGAALQMTDTPEPYEQDVHGIWDLRGERPPPSSIASRQDTHEARQLAHALEQQYSKLGSLSILSQLPRFATMQRGPPPRQESVPATTSE